MIGNDFKEQLIISWNNSLRIMRLRSYQDKIISMKLIIHKIFGEELMILSTVAFQNFESPVLELKELLLFHQRIHRS